VADRCGSVLGLSIVRSIVSRIAKLLELKLDVQSEVGKGSTFSLELPAGAAAAYAEREVGIASEPESGEEGAGHILLVEDDPAVRSATRLLLKAEGYRVTTATSLAQAMECARDTPELDLLITDYYLAGGETGKQVVSSVREMRGNAIKAIMITGDTSRTPAGKAALIDMRGPYVSGASSPRTVGISSLTVGWMRTPCCTTV
jgi:two-component system, sensor histidine kinase